ncbi:MAG: zf-HC2 domain-containing protein [bacterium]|nr:zf-HC2 domain-containing protein [bacterium]
MNCGRCEDRLELYQEGGLDVYTLAKIDRHLAQCARCRATLEELRAIEGALNRSSLAALQPATNFTFAVMAEARALPRPRLQPVMRWAFLGWYLLAAWAIIGVLALVARPLLLSAAHGLAQAGGAAVFALQAVIAAVATLTGGHGALLAVIVGMVLSVDAVLALGVYFIHTQLERA